MNKYFTIALLFLLTQTVNAKEQCDTDKFDALVNETKITENAVYNKEGDLNAYMKNRKKEGVLFVNGQNRDSAIAVASEFIAKGLMRSCDGD